MQQSVPSPSTVQATFTATLFDEWRHLGLSDVVICPGSRSTPLALAASEHPQFDLHVRIDERSAGFFAIGRALVTRRPVAVIVTSGTAAAELHAAVAEADLAGVALLVLTADRPPELHGVGAPQSINQRDLYGSMVRRYEEPGVARLEASRSWRPLARRLWASASGEDAAPGPVHLNAAFIEPLIAAPLELPRGGDEAALPRETDRRRTPVTGLDLSRGRILCVVGPGTDSTIIDECRALDWVVLGDATSRGSLAYFDAVLRDDAFAKRVRPDVVVRLGGLPASKVLLERLGSWGVRVVAMTGAGLVADPTGIVNETVAGVPRGTDDSLRGERRYVDVWSEASARVGVRLDELERSVTELSEPLIARALVAASARHHAPLVVGSSMPVRDVEWWAPPRESATFANRGANGIDGVVSTILGVSAGAKGLGLVGDITMLHDVSGLVDALGTAGGSCVIVVVDNGGGGIFSFLSQASALSESRFELLFGTPRAHDLVAVAAAFGHRARRVDTLAALVDAIDEWIAREGLSVVVAKVGTREENVRYHEWLNALVVGEISE